MHQSALPSAFRIGSLPPSSIIFKLARFWVIPAERWYGGWHLRASERIWMRPRPRRRMRFLFVRILYAFPSSRPPFGRLWRIKREEKRQVAVSCAHESASARFVRIFFAANIAHIAAFTSPLSPNWERGIRKTNLLTYINLHPIPVSFYLCHSFIYSYAKRLFLNLIA